MANQKVPQQSEKQSDLMSRGTSQSPFYSFFPSIWDEFTRQFGNMASSQSGLTLSEDKKNVYVEASLPGLNSSDIDVSIDRGILTISGEKKEEEDDREKKYYRRASRSYSYSIAIPGNIDETHEPKATYKDGIMKIVFSKSQQQQGKKIVVKGA